MRHPDDITHNGRTLTEILRLHGMWLRGEEGGECANLADADLRRADLSGANLSRADLMSANMLGADLTGADLTDADMFCANLFGANLTGANMRGAHLFGANMRGAKLTSAIMSGAHLMRADFTDATMGGATFADADLLCTGNMRQIKTMQIEGWQIGYTHDTLQIGCQRHHIEKWRKWNTEAGREWVAKMDDAALAWADRFLDLVLQIIDASPAEK